jgi:hypothetical protein
LGQWGRGARAGVGAVIGWAVEVIISAKTIKLMARQFVYCYIIFKVGEEELQHRQETKERNILLLGDNTTKPQKLN